MSDELKMDTSKEVFQLNKDILSFKINPKIYNNLISNSLYSNQLQPISEEDIIVTNLTQNYLAFRTKTTKKENYSVNPIYCVISPNENKNINIVFYTKSGDKINSKGHKFRFEAFIIPESQKNEDVKDLFKKYIKNGSKVVGNIQKRHVEFYEPKDDTNILRGINRNLLSESTTSIVSNYTIAEAKNQNALLEEKIQKKEGMNKKLSDIIEDKNSGILILDKNKEEFENLKQEYNELKDQYESLKRSEELLMKRLKNEKINKPEPHGSNKFFYKVPEAREEKLSMKKLMIYFVIFTLVGFYLTK